MLRLTVLSALAFGADAIWDTCPRGPVGSCMMTSCYESRGPTECVDGSCECLEGYCRYPNSRVHVQPRRCRAQVPGAFCHFTRVCYSGGLMSSSCVSGRCLCRTGMHVDENNKCQTGWWPTCDKDTGGTCGWFGCHSSRGEVECTGGKCLCKAGYCAKDGVCVAPEESTALLAANATPPAEYLAEDPEIIREEDWEVALNLAAAAAFVGLPLSMAVAGGAVLLRRRLRRAGSGDFAEKLLDADGDHEKVVG